MTEQASKDDIKFKQAAILHALGARWAKDGAISTFAADERGWRGSRHGYSQNVKTKIDGDDIVFSGISDTYTAKLILLRLHDKMLLDESMTGGGAHWSERYEPAGQPIGSDPAYSWGDCLPTGKYDLVAWLKEKPDGTEDVRYDSKNKTLAINAAKINPSFFQNALKEKDRPHYNEGEQGRAFSTLLHVVADTKTDAALRRAFRDAAKLESPELDPDAIDAFRENVKDISDRLREALPRSGISAYMTPAQINEAVASHTGKKLKVA